MPVFKICDASRQKRKMVKAEDLDELLKKGSDSFSCGFELKKVVTENEGCEIDDRSILLEMNSELLMLLGEEELWSSTAPLSTTLSACSTTSVSPIVTTSSDPHSEDEQAKNSSQGIIELPSKLPEQICPVPSTSQPSVPLPRLSSFVEDCLQSGKILSCFNNLISECANFYTNQHPISNSLQYQQIGRQLYAKYPCIKFNTGQEPWTVFCEKLSQKIRNLRHRKLRKSMDIPTSETTPPKLPRYLPKRQQQIPEKTLSVEDYNKHVSAIQEEMDKIKPNSSHIKMLLQETFQNRRAWLATLPPESWSPLLETFPCFEDMEHVVLEYQLIKKTESLDEERQMMTKLFRIVAETVKNEDLQGTDTEKELCLVRSLEKTTAFDKGKGKKSESLITLKKNISEAKMETVAKTTALSAPSLMVFLDSENKMMEAVIIGDTQMIFCRTNSVIEAVLYLILMYYVTDLEYPRIYSQALGIIQKYVLKDQFAGPTSTKFNKFVLRVDSTWDTI